MYFLFMILIESIWRLIDFIEFLENLVVGEISAESSYIFDHDDGHWDPCTVNGIVKLGAKWNSKSVELMLVNILKSN